MPRLLHARCRAYALPYYARPLVPAAAGVGKSTLMRAIAANKVDGFPPPEQLRTVYVEHDIQVGGVGRRVSDAQGALWGRGDGRTARCIMLVGLRLSRGGRSLCR